MTIRRVYSSEYGLIIPLWNSVWPARPWTVEHLEQEDSQLEEDVRIRFWVAEHEGVVVGLLAVYRFIGSYHPAKWTVDIVVDEAHRGQGIGARLWDEAERFLASREVISVATQVQEVCEDALCFAAKRGFLEEKRDFESRLALQEVPDELLVTKLDSGARVATFTSEDSPELRREMHLLFEEVRKDVPRSAPPTPMSYEQFVSFFIDHPEAFLEVTTLAFVEKRLVGFSTAFRSPDEGIIHQGLTAVDRAYRGRGLAQGLKVLTIREARQMGFKEIWTDNDSRNAPMLAINEKLGFVRHQAVISLIKR